MLRKEQPTHIAVVFDTAAPNTHEEFADYKAHREEIPEDLASSIPYVVQLCEAFNIPVLAIDDLKPMTSSEHLRVRRRRRDLIRT